MSKVPSFYDTIKKNFVSKINFKTWENCFYIIKVTHFIKNMYN